MTDDVRISFSADIAGLQRGLREAQDGVAAATAAMKTGAEQVGSSFASLNQAYAAGVAQRLDLVRGASDEERAIARAGDRAATDAALDGIRTKQSQVREEAQLSEMSHDEERAQLLALESEREATERRHLAFLQSTYADNAVAFADAQRRIDGLAAQSALRRQEIERGYAREVYADYKRSFEQVGSSVAGQVSGMIRGQETLRQAAGAVASSIVQSFVQARIRAVADWAAGMATQTALTQAGEAAKTGAVVAGTAARQGAEETAATASAATTVAAIGRSIVASAAETFAGIFGFLSPVLGPAAAGPAVAGQASVLAAGAALPSFAGGAWSLPADAVAQVHRGEMIVPAGPAAALRAAAEGAGQAQGRMPLNHQTHVTITALDGRDVERVLRAHGKTILRAIDDSVRNGAHLGLNRLRG